MPLVVHSFLIITLMVAVRWHLSGIAVFTIILLLEKAGHFTAQTERMLKFSTVFSGIITLSMEERSVSTMPAVFMSKTVRSAIITKPEMAVLYTSRVMIIHNLLIVSLPIIQQSLVELVIFTSTVIHDSITARSVITPPVNVVVLFTSLNLLNPGSLTQLSGITRLQRHTGLDI